MSAHTVKRALRWCRACAKAVATGDRCACPRADGHVPVLVADAIVGNGVRLGPFVHIYGCTVGEGTRIGAFVEVQRGASIGARCKIGSHSFVCTGVVIGDEVFVGHGVHFCNDRRPRAVLDDGSPVGDGDWSLEGVHVGRRASIGTGCVVLPGVTIGEEAIVGAGTVVAHDVPAGTVVRHDLLWTTKAREH